MLNNNKICVYCGDKAKEKDHVVAKQFFPKNGEYRNTLPVVPSCSVCNREKQKVEDVCGVIFQYGDGSKASQEVLLNRIPKTLNKNKKLSRNIKNAVKQEWLEDKKIGLIVPRHTISINNDMGGAIKIWVQYLVKGLYFYEVQETLPKEHQIRLFWPRSYVEYYLLKDMILKHKYKDNAFAKDEFKYLFSVSKKDPISMWMFQFKSITVFSVTNSPNIMPKYQKLFNN